MCVVKKTLDEDHINQQPMYEEITLSHVQCHKEISMSMEENAAYGNIT